jgi:hypothetical protein
MSIPEQVAIFLRQHTGLAYCDVCLKKNVQLKRPQQAQRVTDALAQTRDFTREKSLCAGCGHDRYVTKAN